MKRRLTALEKQKLPLAVKLIEEYGHDMAELIDLMELTPEDLFERFPDRVLDIAGSAVVLPDELSDEEDDEASERPWD